jgi:hypothetical protein
MRKSIALTQDFSLPPLNESGNDRTRELNLRLWFVTSDTVDKMADRAPSSSGSVSSFSSEPIIQFSAGGPYNHTCSPEACLQVKKKEESFSQPSDSIAP